MPSTKTPEEWAKLARRRCNDRPVDHAADAEPCEGCIRGVIEDALNEQRVQIFQRMRRADLEGMPALFRWLAEPERDKLARIIKRYRADLRAVKNERDTYSTMYDSMYESRKACFEAYQAVLADLTARNIEITRLNSKITRNNENT